MKSMRFLASFVVVAGLAATAGAISVTPDEIISNIPGNSGLSATIDMTWNSTDSLLEILVENTSVSPVVGSDVLLSGVAFFMDGMDITGGTAEVGPGSTLSGKEKGTSFSYAAGHLVSDEWGYRNGNTSGHFNGLPTDTQISTMTADADTNFSGSNIINGPSWGLLADGGDAGGLTSIQDSILFKVTLDVDANDDVINAINDGHVAVTFGSPTGITVFDGGATLAMLGMGLLGLSRIRRKA